MSYGKTQDVIEECGFTANKDIDVRTVQQYLDRAMSIVKSYISKKYNLTCLKTNFTGSQAELLCRQAELLIASGNLLNKEFGYQDGTQKGVGDDKIMMGLDLLKSIQKGEILLLDINDSEYAFSVTGSKTRISGGIESSSSTNQDGQDSSRVFNLRKIF